MKRALPIAGVIAMLAIAGSFFLPQSDLGSVGLAGLRFEQGQLVMDKPKLSGVDNDKRSYSLSADKAVQDAEQPSRITLEGIVAKLPVSETGFANISAGNGLYDADAKTLNLSGTIRAETDDGMTLEMRDADIDIESGQLRSANPVEVSTGRMNVLANAIRVEDNGKTIVFSNGVRVTILPFNEEIAGGANGKTE